MITAAKSGRARWRPASPRAVSLRAAAFARRVATRAPVCVALSCRDGASPSGCSAPPRPKHSLATRAVHEEGGGTAHARVWGIGRGAQLRIGGLRRRPRASRRRRQTRPRSDRLGKRSRLRPKLAFAAFRRHKDSCPLPGADSLAGRPQAAAGARAQAPRPSNSAALLRRPRPRAAASIRPFRRGTSSLWGALPRPAVRWERPGAPGALRGRRMSKRYRGQRARRRSRRGLLTARRRELASPAFRPQRPRLEPAREVANVRSCSQRADAGRGRLASASNGLLAARCRNRAGPNFSALSSVRDQEFSTGRLVWWHDSCLGCERSRAQFPERPIHWYSSSASCKTS